MEAKVMMLALAVVLAVVWAQAEAKGCCTPDEWEGAMGSITGFVAKGKAGNAEGIAYKFYDAKNKRGATFANYTAAGKKRSYKIVKLYSKKDECDGLDLIGLGEGCSRGKMYVVDLATDKCYIKKLYRPFRKACIPDDAKATGEFTMGVGDNSLKVKGYHLEHRGRKFKMSVQLSVTQEGCIPVGEVVVGEAHGVPLMETGGFVDIKAGIKDPSVFDVPKECDETHDGLILDSLEREYSLYSF